MPSDGPDGALLTPQPMTDPVANGGLSTRWKTLEGGENDGCQGVRVDYCSCHHTERLRHGYGRQFLPDVDNSETPSIYWAPWAPAQGPNIEYTGLLGPVTGAAAD